MGWTMAHDDKRDGTAVLREHHPSIHPHPTHPSIHPSIHPSTDPFPSSLPMRHAHVPCSMLRAPTSMPAAGPPASPPVRPLSHCRQSAPVSSEAALPLRGLSCVFIFFYLILI